MLQLSRFVLPAVVAAVGAIVATATVAEVRLKTVTALPKSVIFAKSCIDGFFDKVNKEGKGQVQIQYMGGPEVTPPPEQPVALRNGVFDVLCAPVGYFPGIFPEADALFGSNLTPMEARANGGLAALSKIAEKKLNARILAWGEGGIGAVIYLRSEPKRTPAGGIDLAGLKVRAAPAYREILAAFGATNVMIQAPEVHTALERGVVDGVVWPAIGVADLGWQKFLKVRIAPDFNQVDQVVMINLDKWKSLSDAQRSLLDRVAIAYERESYEFFQKDQKEQARKLEQQGMKTIALEGEARRSFLKTAHEAPWERLKKRDPASYDALRPHFYKSN